jgi:hypothetical protein
VNEGKFLLFGGCCFVRTLLFLIDGDVMPFALYEIEINFGDTVKFLPKSLYSNEYGNNKGTVQSVLLNATGSWEVHVRFGDNGIVVDSRQLERCAW